MTVRGVTVTIVTSKSDLDRYTEIDSARGDEFNDLTESEVEYVKNQFAAFVLNTGEALEELRDVRKSQREPSE